METSEENFNVDIPDKATLVTRGSLAARFREKAGTAEDQERARDVHKRFVMKER